MSGDDLQVDRYWRQLEETNMKHKVSFFAGAALALLLIPTVIAQKEMQQDFLVVYYFGATDIGFCTAPDNIEKIKKLKKDLPLEYENLRFKFVLVCLDENLDTGLKFIKKYGQWDEIAIGGSYGNELALNHLNTTELPSLPHILIFKDTLASGRWNIPVMKRRKLLVDLAGEKQIGDWIDKGYPIFADKNSRR
jgi:hypothetical protein